MSRVKYMTLAQLTRIKGNNYLGEHDKQVDYADYSKDIDRRIWELSDRQMSVKIKESIDLAEFGPVAELEPNEFLLMDTKRSNFDFESVFNPWAYLGRKLTIDMF